MKKGFTLIELLVVIAIIGILSSVVLVSMQGARAKARDARRLQDMKQIVTALQLYFNKYERYPSISGDGCCDGWDQGPCGTDVFIGALTTEGFLKTPVDPSGGTGTDCYGYNYYRYSAGNYGCDAVRGAFFVLGVRDMETSGRPYPTSPGWSCPSRNWQTEFDWVVGGFEN
ncbi:MAG: type II secretion system protein [Candidatus Nealsonbacteria bacterium]